MRVKLRRMGSSDYSTVRRGRSGNKQREIVGG
jgi:hypothetical protein